MMGMEMPYVCTDGQWTIDMSSFVGGQGGMNWGDAVTAD
jgi:hypothetical protein